MKATLIIGVIAAALGGALLATVVSADDKPAEVVTIERSAPNQAAGGAVAERPARSRPPASRERAAGLYIEPDDRPIGQAELDRVRDGALAAVGGGIVTDIDRSDDLGVAYEVEVVENGMDVDVHLDGDLNPVAQSYDD